MTAEEFIKQGNTYIVITINDELWVDCYKTSQVEFTNEGRTLEIHEDEIHNAYITLCNMRDRIDSFRNFVYYDMFDKIRIEKLEK